MGFEDVAVVDKDETLYIAYTDNIYRGSVRGTFELLSKLLEDSRIDKNLHLLIQENLVPRIVLKASGQDVRSYRDKQVNLKQLISCLQISYDVSGDYNALKDITRENRSASKIDLVLHPQLTLNSLWFDKLYGAVFNIAPAIEVSLWKGASFTGQVIFPVWNNLSGEIDHVRAGMVVLRQEFRIPRNIFLTISAGNFSTNRIGTDIEFVHKTDNGLWEMGANAGLTGLSTFDSGKWKVTNWKKVNASGFLAYNEPHSQLHFNLSCHRYIYGDYGVRFGFSRYFGEVMIGFFGMTAGEEYNGGFHFSVPLSRKKRAGHNAFRIGIPEYFNMEYEAMNGSDYAREKLGHTYRTRLGDRRASRNYNPDYVKSLLLRFAGENQLKDISK